jgi:hypothetical protein
MSTEDEVRKASEQFYAALNRMANGDARPLADIWSQGAGVTTMHPIGGREVGWDKVRASFAQVAEIASEGRIRLDDQLIRVVGDVAYELGSERGQGSCPVPWCRSTARRRLRCTGTQRATAGSRVGAVSLTVCSPSSCM